jgi:hypothetical protein
MLIDVDIIEQAISALNRLKEIAAKNEEKWQPKGGSYHVSCHDHVHSTIDISESATNFGSRFESREAAEEAAKVYRKYHRLYKLAEELNGDWKPDWSNPVQPKYGISEGKNARIPVCLKTERPLGTICFKSEIAAEKAIKIWEQEDD